MDSVEAVEKILDYSFANKSLLKDTLKEYHVGVQPLSFRRLEFLGDSVLGVAFTNYLHLTFPDLKDYELKELQMANTCNDKFARVAVKRGLIPFVICDSRNRTLTEKIKAFSEAVSKEDDLVWYQGSMEAPKSLANFVEAIAGAVYIDVNFDLQRLWEILKGLLEPLFMPDDFRRRYQPVATLLRLGKKRVVYKCCREDKTRVVAKVYFDGKFIAYGHDKTKSRARIAAAKVALQKLSIRMPKAIQKLSKLSKRMPINERRLHVKKKVAKKKVDKKKVDKGSLDLEKGHGKVEVFHIQTRSCTRKLQLQKSLEEKKNLQMQECSEEKENLQMQESLEEKKNLQMQESSQKKKRSLQMDSVEAVEKILNYSFSNKSLLKEAITQHSGMKCRLEILGHTALCHAFTEYLYFEYPTLATMGLDQLRSTNKRNEKSARVAVKHGLDKFLIFDRSFDTIFDEKVKLFSEAVSKEDGPVPYGGLVIAPRILGDLVDSVAGAVYVDVNFHVPRLWEVCKGLFEPIYTLDDLLKLSESMPIEMVKETVIENTEVEEETDIENTEIEEETVIENTEVEEETVIQNTEIEEETVIENTEIEDVKDKLIKICRKRKWPNPIYSVVAQDPVKGFVCSAEIETPTEEGTLFIKGDSKKKQKLAETNSAYHMIRALEFSIKDDLRS